MESDTEEHFEPHDSEEEGGFSIGTVVFPLDQKQKDFVDEGAVLIVDADTYLGSFLGKFLSEEIVGATTGAEAEEVEEEEGEDGGPPTTPGGQWKVLGTLCEKKKVVPDFLWAVMRNDDYDAYMKEVLKCGVIIYDVTHDQSLQRFAEIRAICDSLRSNWPKFRTRRVFILISSLHSWSNTGPKGDAAGDAAALNESNYRFRRTHPLYRDLQLLERYVVATGKMTKGMVKAYVIGSGVIYGGEEYCLHHWFKSAWHNSKYLQVYGDGRNRVPTIYIKDLAKIVQNVMESTPPKQRYIIAVDPVTSQQCQISKAISNVLATGRLKRCPLEDIYLNKELTTFQADQLLLDLKIESTFCREHFEIERSAAEGFPSIVKKLAEEYRQERNLQPLKILILGPPGVGKSTLARQLSDLYHLHHFTLEEIVKSTVELLKEVAGDQSEPDFVDLETGVEESARTTASALLSEIDATEGEVTLGQLGPDLLAKIIRYRLLSHPCQNQGFILDGFPESFEQARLMFIAGEDAGEYAAEEEGEDGIGDPIDIRLIPDRVFLLEAPDGFLKDRLASLPITKVEERHLENNFEQLLAKYRDENEVYEKSVMAYFDQQETVYVPIDVVADESPFLKQSVSFVSMILGRPRNYGISKEEEEALMNAQKYEMAEKEQKELEDLALLESRELEERRTNIQKWMAKLAKVKKEEFEREEAALTPLRNYLMSHIVPTLTRGLIDVSRARPEDPIDYLAEFLFQNNPGGISPVNPSNMNQK